MKSWQTLLLVVAVVLVVFFTGGTAVAALVSGTKRQTELADLIRQATPDRIGQWADELAAAASATAPTSAGITEERWAMVLAGIMDRESGGGLFLHPHGPGGTGDGGHGRGLMQIDDRENPALTAGEDWKDPAYNVLSGAQLLRANFDALVTDAPDLDGQLAGAVASYNADISHIRQAFAVGGDIDAHTTGKNYSADVLQRADSFSGLAA